MLLRSVCVCVCVSVCLFVCVVCLFVFGNGVGDFPSWNLELQCVRKM